ncbi:hypothetical protein PFY01_03085 [Brevundimonas vesicularis]|uniref:hypothetical protein n=1 Tax=Brevundimonas vesicularis TaxID=41276 RepID=UPI0022EC49E5|nr:hypothetical protein [Brevundimonas vesicularis]WBT06679.1 hypothetical protein PFY01_03085 [Brevundimonas vesicularis]
MTVAQAAAELTRRGDKIDASNVSRYLARNPDIASRKEGRCRYVDLAALILHRSGNTLSIGRRDMVPEDAVPTGLDDDDGGGVPLTPGIASEIQQANLRLKQLQVRDKEREDALAEGDLVPAADVLAVINGVMQTFVTELERVEMSIATRHGRVVAADFRKARKDAQAAASAKLKVSAEAQLHPSVSGMIAADQAAAP